MEAIEAASGALNDCFNNNIFLTSLVFQRLVNKLQSDSKNPYNSQNERSKGKWSKIEEEGPSKSFADREGSSNILIWGKVPGANCNDEGVVEDGLDQLVYPEEHEYLSKEHILLIVIKLNFFHLASSCRLSYLSRTD